MSSTRTLGINLDADVEVAETLRILARRPWLVVGRDDEEIAVVRRNVDALRAAVSRLGWALVVERDLVRLKKTPPAGRRLGDWALQAPSPLACSWFFLLAATAESLPHQVMLGQLVEAAKATAAEAGIPVDSSREERRAIVQAIQQLIERGVIEDTDGEVAEFLEDEQAAVLLTIFHTRILHLVTVSIDPAIDPVGEPQRWLESVSRETEPARRMRQRLVDDTCVHISDLDEAEIDWLSRRLREDGVGTAKTFGLVVERRGEGAAFVVPEDEFRYPKDLGDVPFPSSGGIVSYAALLLSDFVAAEGDVGTTMLGTGWRGMLRASVLSKLTAIAASQSVGSGGWPADRVNKPDRLLDDIERLLIGVGLLRVIDDHWWLSPVMGRWTPPEPPRAKKTETATEPNDNQMEMF